MEKNPGFNNYDDDGDEEEECVLLDLSAVAGRVHIPPNAPYVISGLDTMNPILTIDNKVKLIGEYEETIGTCLVFEESDAPPMVDPKQTPNKQVQLVTQLHKILKFRLLSEVDTEENTTKEKIAQE